MQAGTHTVHTECYAPSGHNTTFCCKQWVIRLSGADPGIMKGGGLAPREATFPPCSPGKFWIIHSISCNLVQSGSKIDVTSATTDRSAQRHGLRRSVYEI